MTNGAICVDVHTERVSCVRRFSSSRFCETQGCKPTNTTRGHKDLLHTSLDHGVWSRHSEDSSVSRRSWRPQAVNRDALDYELFQDFIEERREEMQNILFFQGRYNVSSTILLDSVTSTYLGWVKKLSSTGIFDMGTNAVTWLTKMTVSAEWAFITLDSVFKVFFLLIRRAICFLPLVLFSFYCSFVPNDHWRLHCFCLKRGYEKDNLSYTSVCNSGHSFAVCMTRAWVVCWLVVWKLVRRWKQMFVW